MRINISRIFSITLDSLFVFGGILIVVTNFKSWGSIYFYVVALVGLILLIKDLRAK